VTPVSRRILAGSAASLAENAAAMAAAGKPDAAARCAALAEQARARLAAASTPTPAPATAEKLSIVPEHQSVTATGPEKGSA
jgi:hypothetical protein